MNNSTFTTTTSATPTLVVGLGPIELWIVIVVFFLLGGFFTFIAYLFVCVGILRDKTLRTRFFVVLWNLVLCRACLSGQYFIIGIYRTLRTLLIAPSRVTSGMCNLVHFWLLQAMTWEMMLLLILVLDRSMAIMAPHSYRLLTKNQSIFICAFTFILVFILKIPWAFSRANEMVSCANSYSGPTDQFNNYTQNIDMVILCLIVTVYAVLILFVRRKISHMKSQGSYNSESSDSVALKRQLELMPTLRNLVLLHCGISLVSRILRMCVGVVEDADLAARLSAYAGLFLVVDLAMNFVVLIWGNQKVRQAAFPWCKKMQVEQGTVSQGKWAKAVRTGSNGGIGQQYG